MRTVGSGPENKKSESRVSLGKLRAMKSEGLKIVGVVAWDYQIAQMIDRVGVDLVSVGDSVGVNLWGHANPFEITLDEILVVSKAVRRGVKRALVSVDLPFGPLQQGPAAALEAAVRIVKEAGADLVKLDGASEFPDIVSAIARAGIPVFAQFGITPQTSMHLGLSYDDVMHRRFEIRSEMIAELITTARRLESCGAALLDFTHSGPEAGPAVVREVSIPVVGGRGGGPWLDGRVKLASAAIGYGMYALDDGFDGYATVARTICDAIKEYGEDVRMGRQIKGTLGSSSPRLGTMAGPD
jgi:3-methyl-2-oxobutanoate hydroxymethyltransferase